VITGRPHYEMLAAAHLRVLESRRLMLGSVERRLDDDPTQTPLQERRAGLLAEIERAERTHTLYALLARDTAEPSFWVHAYGRLIQLAARLEDEMTASAATAGATADAVRTADLPLIAASLRDWREQLRHWQVASVEAV
jgi:hypothetical protein